LSYGAQSNVEAIKGIWGLRMRSRRVSHLRWLWAIASSKKPKLGEYRLFWRQGHRRSPHHSCEKG